MKNKNEQTCWDKLIQTAVTTTKQKSFNVSLPLKIENEIWNAYGAEVSNRDILFFCKEGTVTFLVDTYGNKNHCELFDWSKDDEK